ncbi:MAG TPA: hypothetical protein VFF65_07745, partial [Phycisphaerales bacterium]|nr:hypothetical protein [Phycisphaerales bacterium]
MRTSLIALLAAVSTGSALAQDGYTYEMRLVPDGMSGSAGPTPGTTFNFAVGATRIGFWLQARVAQTTGQNWGIARASSPSAGEASFIALTDPAALSSLSRGVVNTGGTAFGRAAPYRNGGVASGNTGNAPGATPFPGSAGNENGTLDNGGSGFISRRI